MSVGGRSVVVVFIGALLWVACGSDSSGSDDPIALCKEGCAKVESLCFADAGGPSECNCTPPDGGITMCTNQSEINAAFRACLEKNTCAEFLSCKIPKCVSGGSGGG